MWQGASARKGDSCAVGAVIEPGQVLGVEADRIEKQNGVVSQAIKTLAILSVMETLGDLKTAFG